MNANPITFSRFTSLNPSRLTKTFSLLSDGRLHKANGGMMYAGYAETLKIQSISELGEIISKLNHSQALAFGVSVHEKVEITTSALITEGKAPLGAIARVNKNFSFQQCRSIMLLDIDDLPGDVQPKNHAEARALLIASVPELACVPMLISDSASTHVFRKDTGQCLKAGGRYHVFVPVSDGTEIPEIGKILITKMRAAGFIFDKISASGARLKRTLIDGSVWQGSRLSFDSGSYCNHGLEQRRSVPSVFLPDASDLSLFALLPPGSPPPAPQSPHTPNVEKKYVQQNGFRSSTQPAAVGYAKKDIIQAMSFINSEDYHVWIKIGLGLKNDLGEDGWGIWRDWSLTAKNADSISDLRKKWDGFHPDGSSGGVQGMLKMAFRAGFLDDVIAGIVKKAQATMTAAQATWKPANPAAPMPDLLPRDEATKKLQEAAQFFVENVKNWYQNECKTTPPILGVEGTTGLTKTQIIKDFIIHELTKAGIPTRFLAALRNDAELMSKKTEGFWRKARSDCTDKALDLEETVTHKRVFELFPEHCPRTDAAHAVGEEEHQVFSNICLTCPDGAKRQARIAKERNQSEAEINAHILRAQALGAKEGLTLAQLSDKCWLDHQSHCADEINVSIVSRGSSPKDFDHDSGHGVLIADESLMLTHTNLYKEEDFQDALRNIQADISALKITLKLDIYSEEERSEKERELSFFVTINERYIYIKNLLAQNANTNGAVIEIDVENAKKMANVQVWEIPEVDEEITQTLAFKKIPRRAAQEISQMKQYRILDGNLLVSYSSGLNEAMNTRSYPILLMDATMPASTKHKICELGGQVVKITVEQKAAVIRDNRIFDGALPKNKDGTVDEVKSKKVIDRLYLPVEKHRHEAQKMGLKGAFFMCKKEKAIRLLSRSSGLSVDEIVNMKYLWNFSIEQGIGWWGWHDKSHNEWSEWMPVMLDTPSLKREDFVLQYENYRAEMSEMGIELPAYDNKWVKKQWVTTGEFSELSAGELPENPAIRDYFLSIITTHVVQAIGRARLIWNSEIDRVYSYSGYPALLNNYGLQVKYEKLGITRTEKTAENQALAVGKTMKACAELAQTGVQVSRQKVEEHMRAQGEGVAHAHYSDARAALMPALATAFAARGPGAGEILKQRLAAFGAQQHEAISALNHFFQVAGRDLQRLKTLVQSRLNNLPSADDFMSKVTSMLAEVLNAPGAPAI